MTSIFFSRCKAEFLIQLDGFVRYKHPLLFLASTNLPWTIDPGLLRRFQNIINIGLPGQKHRESILYNNLSLIPEKNAWKSIDIAAIASITDGFSGSDLQRACAQATKKMLRKRVAIKDKNLQNRKEHTSRNNVNSRHLCIGRYKQFLNLNMFPVSLILNHMHNTSHLVTYYALFISVHITKT